MNYKQLKSDYGSDKGHPLRAYLSALASVKKNEFDAWKRPEQMAFLINAYNGLTVQLVVEHYPVKSIKDIGTFFKTPWKIDFFSLLDGSLTRLDPIEREWLLPRYGDFRVLAALSSASMSSPRLQHLAFEGAKLEVQLDSIFREFLNDKNLNVLDETSGALEVSKVFDWFKSDFKKAGGVVKLFEMYGGADWKAGLGKDTLVKYRPFDWGLNESR